MVWEEIPAVDMVEAVDTTDMKMRAIFYIILLMVFNGCLATNPKADSDHDGVADIHDRCKNTPFL